MANNENKNIGSIIITVITIPSLIYSGKTSAQTTEQMQNDTIT
jgi:hypothetical protein